MIPVLLGAATTWMVVKLLAGNDGARRSYPSIPSEWWKPHDAFLYVKAHALVALDQSEELFKMYERYADAYPDHTLSLLLRVRAASQRSQWAKALQLAEELEEREPTFAVGPYEVAKCCERLGDKKAAIAAARRFLALEPTSSLAPEMETLITRLGERPAPKAKSRRTARSKSADARRARA